VPVSDVELAGLAKPRLGRRAATFYGTNQRPNANEGLRGQLMQQLQSVEAPVIPSSMKRGELVDLWNTLGREFPEWRLPNKNLSTKQQYQAALHELRKRVAK
jgi:hypothetical protein